MATKPEAKSKIPLKIAKKELQSERTRMTFGNCSYPKTTGNKENRDKSKTCQNAAGNTNKPAGNLKVTTKEQLKEVKQDSKPKQAAVRSDIETLSQNSVNLMKTDDNTTNILQKSKDRASSKTTTGPKKSTSPSVSVQPKNCQPFSGLILKPAVKRSTVAVKPFNIEVNPPKIRRSITEYDFKSARPKVGTIQPQQKDKNTKVKERNTVGPNCSKTTKSEIPSNLKKIEKKPLNEFQAPPKNSNSSGRMSKNFPVDKNSAKAVASKPLRRSNTMHAFESVPILKRNKVVLTNKSPVLNPVPEIANMEKVKTPVTPENSMLEMPMSDNLRSQFTPKKEIPHGGLVMNVNAARITKTKIKAFGNVK
ncbi:hypothetical protein JTE90_009784 [Oedothorax gibbosus]|uniref:Uncharacterized protein n=1 Tax=Oedothorax gibbosus TaxID=931172 RepID=A0AAV6V7U3_9ARAC|nr:hypothetical protein JTE90_009784 [Oedothorax gibbosus]